MKRLSLLSCAIMVITLNIFCTTAKAADLTFQFINDTERPLSMKLFSRSDSHQEWPSKTKAYTIRPDTAVQQLKISCEEGEQICWGAWQTVQRVSGEMGGNGQRPTHTTKYLAGAGERGIRSCKSCCQVCKDGTLTPVAKLNDPDNMAR